MDHYFTNKPSTTSDEVQIKDYILGSEFAFWVDNGVFSKNGIDFGTRTLVEAVDLDTFPEGSILDVGCGWGALTIPLAKKYPERQFQMVDVNERALQLATKNAALNGCDNVTSYISNQYRQVTDTEFAGILTNPPIRAGKEVVHGILVEALDHLKPGGKLVAVIQKKQGAPSAKAKMEAVFGNVTELERSKGYWILQSEKE